MPLNHYDLFDQPGCEAKSVLIVSPYVEREFFQEVASRLRPKRMTVVIDDGCRAEDVAMVRQSALDGTELRVALGAARGLAHLKVFYVRWQTADGKVARTFVWGSGNATQQAFRGDFNAELMCRARLTSSSHQSILNWVKGVETKAGKVELGGQIVEEVRDAELAAGVHIRLPGMTLRSTESKATTFDLWLQRGRIVATYRPDPSFLRVSVTLLADIPRGKTERKIAKLVDIPSRRNIGVRYLESINPSEEPEQGEDGGKRWRAPFCVWTANGEWCSDACYREKKDRFRAAKHEERGKNLKKLSTLRQDPERRKARKAYLKTLRDLCNAFGQEQAGRYLRCVGQGRLDERFYKTLFENCVSRDLALAADPEYTRQYINGCEVSDMPRFRTDPMGWESFVQSFSRNICKETRKPSRTPGTRGSQSRLVLRLREAIGDAKTLGIPTELTELLRTKWDRPLKGKGMMLGEYMDGYQNHAERSAS